MSPASRQRVVRGLANAGRKLINTPPLLIFVGFVLIFGVAWLTSSVSEAGAELVSDVLQSTAGTVIVLAIPFVLGGGLTFWWRSRRNRAFRRLAGERGWMHTARSDLMDEPYPSPGAHTTFATNVVEGLLSDYTVQLYEHHWISGSGKRRSEHVVGVGVVRLPVSLPTLTVVPEGMTAAVAAWLTGNDVDIEHAEFNRRYRVKLDFRDKDELSARRYAVDVLNPRAVEALLTTPPFAWRIDGTRLIATWPVTANTRVLVNRLEAMIGIAGHLPSFRSQNDR